MAGCAGEVKVCESAFELLGILSPHRSYGLDFVSANYFFFLDTYQGGDLKQDDLEATVPSFLFLVLVRMSPE